MSALQLEGVFIPMCDIQFLSCRSENKRSWDGYSLSNFDDIGIFQVLLGVQSLEKLENSPRVIRMVYLCSVFCSLSSQS